MRIIFVLFALLLLHCSASSPREPNRSPDHELAMDEDALDFRALASTKEERSPTRRGGRAAAARECFSALCPLPKKSEPRPAATPLEEEAIKQDWQLVEKDLGKLEKAIFDFDQLKARSFPPKSLPQKISKQEYETMQAVVSVLMVGLKMPLFLTATDEQSLREDLKLFRAPKYVPRFPELILKLFHLRDNLLRPFADLKSLGQYVRTHFPNSSEAEIARNIRSAIFVELKAIEAATSLPVYRLVGIYPEEINNPHSTLSLPDLYSIYQNAVIFRSFTAEPVFREFRNHGYDFKAAQAAYLADSDHYQTNLNTLKAQYKNNEYFQDVRSFCRRQIEDTLLNAPGAQEKTQIEAELQNIKALAQQLVKLPTEQQQKAFATKIEQISITALEGRDQEREYIREMIRREVLDKKRTGAFDFGEELKKHPALALVRLVEMERKREPAFGNLLSFCGRFGSKSFTEAIRSTSGEMFLSKASYQDLSLGRGIMAHEVGHVVYLFLTTAGLETTSKDLACVEKFQNPLGFTPGKNQFVVEDFADRFAARVLEKLKSQDRQTVNFACALAREESGSDQPWFYDFKTKHAPPLLRAVHVQGLLGNLPNECRFLQKNNTCED